MIWLFAGGVAVLAFAAAVLLFKAHRRGWEAIAATLLLGLAGYALQGSPGLPGLPKAPAQSQGDGSALVNARRELSGQDAVAGNRWLMIADALTRRGQFGDASSILLGAVEENPQDGDAWLALGNALVGHAEGNVTPAALLAYQRAAQAMPDHPGPPFFLALAMAQGGRLSEGRQLWADLLARTPKDAPWRADLAQRLTQLDAFIAEQSANTGQPAGQR